ncbi:MAG: hypothetical protein A3F47_00070 [Candidatus Staskawiczbacteria bacterium RIFCSPHIGHO2_12_FULL_38_11]|uniref:Uncharacterized protein n=1 Tax=Candidatus Staskawiczbacteria bacterium RIFCSPHIGHO2_12_FULL_38_11 TaxID=1802209 RepID=A0A1G2I7T2_9BACT|nr:MAG: hypothetical protein A3F47_00070 [Candidatus Staskawiczbacteria bacterium RIFCSPHIGHO2_12_FULL_38_11]
MKLNAEVVYSLARQIAKELEQENDFEADPEAFTVGLFVAAKRSFPLGGTIYGTLTKAFFENTQAEVAKLLGRKKVTVK